MICKGEFKKFLNPLFVTEHRDTFVLTMEWKRDEIFLQCIHLFLFYCCLAADINECQISISSKFTM